MASHLIQQFLRSITKVHAHFFTDFEVNTFSLTEDSTCATKYWKLITFYVNLHKGDRVCTADQIIQWVNRHNQMTSIYLIHIVIATVGKLDSPFLVTCCRVDQLHVSRLIELNVFSQKKIGTRMSFDSRYIPIVTNLKR